jgi:hypothetical protein
MKKTTRKLQVSRTTVQQLTGDKLARVRGGRPTVSDGDSVWCTTNTVGQACSWGCNPVPDSIDYCPA